MSKLTPGLLLKRIMKANRKSGHPMFRSMKSQAVNHHDPARQPKPSKMVLWLNSLPTE